MGPSGNPLEDLQPVVATLPPFNLPVLVPQAMKNDMDEILPERGTGFSMGTASPYRRMNPRSDVERIFRHFTDRLKPGRVKSY